MSIPKTQVGYGFRLGSKKLVKYENRPVLEPGPNEVLLKIEAAGMCQSDVHILIAQETNAPREFIMGHEVAGLIAKVGSALANSKRYAVGSRHCLCIVNSCGVCVNCRTGSDNLCDGFSGFGINEDGGYQQYLLVKNIRNLIPIPDNIDYATAAVASDSVLTPFHAIQKVRSMLQPNTKVLVIGLGGLGLNALQILRTYGTYIVASDLKAENKSLALANGANEFYTDLSSKENTHKPESFDVVIDLVGVQASTDACQKYVKSHGKILMIGLGRFKLNFLNYDLARREVEVIFSFGGTSAEQIKVLDWISKGKLKPIVEVKDMDYLPEYLERLAHGKITGRIAFKPKI